MTEPSRINYRLIISGILELLGIGLFVIAGYMIAPFLGIAIGAVGAMAVARAVDPPAGESLFTRIVDRILYGSPMMAPPTAEGA